MRKLTTLIIAVLAATSGFAENGIPDLKHPKDKFWGSAWGWAFIISIIVFLVAVVQSAIEQRNNRRTSNDQSIMNGQQS